MQFIDEVDIQVEAGKGGDGCLSFRREKYVPKGGPDGGNGGQGGNVYLEASSSINTLVDYRRQRIYRAKNGKAGMGSNRTGASAKDLILTVPVGTLIYDVSTNERLGDLNQPGQRLLVAQGGERGLGNAHFKSSTNQAPQHITYGTSGEQRQLHLELHVLADVGLLGYPNAGKSTLIQAVSAARPKVASYPFTTLTPQLGVVRTDSEKSFVIADIPGLIEGASKGTGLGIQFLKHLSRTRLLLHVIDLAAFEQCAELIQAIQNIQQELTNYEPQLADKPQWLVCNKIDQLSEQETHRRIQWITQQLQWQGPIYRISAMTKQGLQILCHEIITNLNS